MVTGASGQVGSYVIRELQGLGLRYLALAQRSRGEAGILGVNLLDQGALDRFLRNHQVDALINCAGMADPFQCFQDPHGSMLMNGHFPVRLFERLVAIHPKAYMLHLSTDMVFSGVNPPYAPEDACDSLSRYGVSKSFGENAFLEAGGHGVARLSNVYGTPPEGRSNFFVSQVERLERNEELTLFTDEIRSFIDFRSAAKAIVEVTRQCAHGIFHIGSGEGVSRYAFGMALANKMGVDSQCIQGSRAQDLEWAEPRPLDLTLSLEGNPSFLSFLKDERVEDRIGDYLF